MAAHYTFTDHSGLHISRTFDNPYDGLLEQCENDPVQVQAVYQRHRMNRNAQQKDRLLSPEFQGVTIDEILSKLEAPSKYPGFKDPRHCLVFWARPTAQVRSLIEAVQRELQAVLPNLWVMPSQSLHMTALEVTHSRTAPEIETLVDTLLPCVSDIANTTRTYRARLVKPLLSFDAQAFALSFLPAAGEPGRTIDEDTYTYHHLRQSLFDKVQAAGLKVDSRYVVPSAHLTVGRYITTEDLQIAGSLDPAKVQKLVDVIERINARLEKEHINEEWLVGQETGLTCRRGALWYGGGGETVFQGEGF